MTTRKTLVAVILMLALCLSAASALAVTITTDAELIAAVEAANSATSGPVVITLADNTTFTADVTVMQHANVDVTIQGGNNTVYMGTIAIHGNNNLSAKESITIKNIAFVDDPSTSKAYDFITTAKNSSSASHATTYPHNVTIQNCSFTGDYQNDIVAVRLSSASNVVISDCVANGVHSLLQGQGIVPQGGSTYGLQVLNCTVSGATSGGLNLGSSAPVLIDECSFTAAKYAVRSNISEQTSYEKSLTITSSVLNAETPVVLRNVKDADAITLNVEDNTMVYDNEDNSWLSVTNSSNVTTEDMLNTDDLKNVEADNKVLSYNEYMTPVDPIVPVVPGSTSSVPQTGDNSNIALWISLMAISAISFMALGRKSRFN